MGAPLSTAPSREGVLAPLAGGLEPTVSRELGATLVRAALGAAWTARNPREPFAERPRTARTERLYYRAEDAWESPIWRLPPTRDGRGEPVVLVAGLGIGHESFDFSPECSLARRLQEAGFDVYMAGLRGGRGSVPPPHGRAFDFDDLVSFDIPAILERIRGVSGCPRVLWVGHGLGGQLAYAHLARGGRPDLAGLVTMGAAVRFTRPRTQARLAAAAARLLPPELGLPVRALQQLLAAGSRPGVEGGVAGDGTDGPVLRGLMLHGGEDVGVGLARQLGRWIEAGVLCDRNDDIDYLAALGGCSLPLLAIASEGDEVCPPAHAKPVVERWCPERARWWLLGHEWGHIDPLVGRDARDHVHCEVVRWFEPLRAACWERAWR